MAMCLQEGGRPGEGGVRVFCKCFEMYLCVSEMNLKEIPENWFCFS